MKQTPANLKTELAGVIAIEKSVNAWGSAVRHLIAGAVREACAGRAGGGCGGGVNGAASVALGTGQGLEPEATDLFL